MQLKSNVIEGMIRAVQAGYSPRSAFTKYVESTLTWHPGSTVKINKDTTATMVDGSGKEDGGSVPLKHGDTVTIVGVGSGDSGVDPMVRLPDGKTASVPFYDIGESLKRRGRKGRRLHEDPIDAPPPAEGDEPPAEADGDATPDEGDDDDERVVRVELTKPLSPEAEDWLKTGHKDVEGLELPDMPEDDQPDGVKFLMKAKDQEALGSAIGSLKNVAGENLVKVEPADKSEWKRS